MHDNIPAWLALPIAGVLWVTLAVLILMGHHAAVKASRMDRRGSQEEEE